MHPTETQGGTPNYKFRYINTKGGTPPRVADLQKTIHSDMGIDPNLELNIPIKELNELRGFDNFLMTKVARLRPRNSNLEMKNESYVRMYDMIVATKGFGGFNRDGTKQDSVGLTNEQLGNSLNTILEKKPMEAATDLASLTGQMSQSDFDLIVTAYLSQGRVDFALDLIQNADKYLITKDKGGKSPEQLTSATLTRLYNPNINVGHNLFDVASVVLKGYPNDDLYYEMRDTIAKWPTEHKNAVVLQTGYLDTKLGAKK